jgi:putative FmdB family regulatory protein
MPIYQFRCPKCLVKEEHLLPIANRDDTRLHSCGTAMERVISAPYPALFKTTNRNKVLDTLNAEADHPVVDDSPVRGKRSQMALAKGLNYTRPLEERIFTGF